MDEFVTFIGDVYKEMKNYIGDDSSDALAGFYFGVMSSYALAMKFDSYKEASPKQMASVLIACEQMIECIPAESFEILLDSFGGSND